MRIFGTVGDSAAPVLALFIALTTVAVTRGSEDPPGERQPHDPQAVRPAGASYQIFNLMPAFWRFWDRAEGLDLEEQATLFRTQVVAAHPEVYTPEVLGLPSGQSVEEALPAVYPKYHAWVTPHLGRMRELSQALERDLPAYDARFREAFPDFDYSGRVYFMNALGAFDGALRQVEGETALLFGLEVIATIYEDPTAVAPLFHHELFHLHHRHVQQQSTTVAPDAGGPAPLEMALWGEGLATYVARQLNPEASDLVIFGLPPNTPSRAREMLPSLVARLQERLDSTSPDDYRSFFLGNAPDADPPSRSGYYVGYLVAEELGRSRSLRELAALQGAELRTAIDAALKRLAAPDARPATPGA